MIRALVLIGLVACCTRAARPCPATVTPAPIRVVVDPLPCDPGPVPVEPALAWTLDAGRFVLGRERFDALQFYLIAVERWTLAVNACNNKGTP